MTGTKKRLSLTDQAFLKLESPEVSAHVGCLATFSRPPGAGPELHRELVADLKAATVFAQPFNYRLSRSPLRAVAPSWEILPDNEIDLDYHFRHSGLPWPGGERELGVLVSRLHSRPLDPTKPLWECHLIEGLAGPAGPGGTSTADRFALFFKIHHALMDGVRGTRRLARMLSPDPEDRELRPLWSIGSSGRRTSGEPKPGAGVKHGAKLARGLLAATGDIVKQAYRPTDPAIGVPFVAPHSTVLNSRVSRQRRVATQTYDFERVRAVAKAADATVNDVFLGICAGALRRYLVEIGAESVADLVTGAPVSIRRPGDDDERSNAIAFVIVKLFAEIADPVERISAIQRSATLAKQRLRELPEEVIDQYGVLTNGPFILQTMTGLAGRLRPPYNLVISNVPGPIEPQYLRGARLEQAYPLSMVMHGQTLNITGFSTAGRFNIGFVGCRDRLPHMQRLAVYTGQALDELEVALGVSAKGSWR